MTQEAKLKSLFKLVSTRHGNVAITTAFVGTLTDFLSPIGGWYVSTGIAVLCALFLAAILVNRKRVSEKIEKSQFLSQWIGGALPCDTSCIKAPAVQYLAIGMLVFGYTSYMTKAYAGDGGVLASKFDQVKRYQTMMGMITSMQKDIGKVTATVNEIDATTKNIQHGVDKIEERLEQAAEADRDPAKQLQAMGTSWDLESFIKMIDTNDIKRLNLFMDGGFVYTTREASDQISLFFEADKFSGHLSALNYLRSRGVDFIGEFNPKSDEYAAGALSPLGRAAINGSEKAVQWLLEGANASSLAKYKVVLFDVQLRIYENLKKAAESGLDKYGPEDRADQLATIDRNVRILSLMVSRGADKSHADFRLYQNALTEWLHLKYEHMEDSNYPGGFNGYFHDRLSEKDSLVLAEHLKPLLAVLAPTSRNKKSALDKSVMREFVDTFNNGAISEAEWHLTALAEGRVAYVESLDQKRKYESEYKNRIRELKAKREIIRSELRI